ncbi:hypothetical protein FVB43_10300 [Erwinia rhapontici]|uniref:hypothetical protein n=1 Tax=Erwinia rhapontici TaxID=55212 RepID=UPI0014383105|nr:hypothetical protein [Erwinia rhapontici]NKG30433.1 hypothetical protein [Erwinia rhapontici]
MPAGTIALTNNSAAVTGTGTSFGTELAANDFIVATVGGVTYTLGIESVDSATALTLSKIYDGPTTATAAWTPLPAAAMSLISAQTAADVARALRAANFDKVNWQQVFSELGDITVTLPDGSQFQGPSWRKISELLATLDVGSITEIAAQIHADAEQVASDKSLILQAADNAIAANNSAQQAKEGAQAADQSAQQSKADATTQAGIAKAEADRAKAEADRAAASNPDNSLLKSQNLNDLPDKSESRKNLDVYSRAEVDGKGGGYVGRAFWHPLRTSVPGGNSPADGQVVNRTGAYASLWAECAAGRLPVVTDAVWLADTTKRGCYSSGDGSTTFRFPDYNGVQPGSIPAPVMRGDGGLTDGTIQQNAAPAIRGSLGGYWRAIGTPDGAFAASAPVSSNTAGTATPTYTDTNFDASRSNLAYGRDGATEVRMNSLVGCWVIQFAGVANNSGSIDALALATRIEQVSQSVTAVSNRIGYALVTTTTDLALGSRTSFANPFGNTTPVILVAEFYHQTLGVWVSTGLGWNTGNGNSYGVAAYQNMSAGLVLCIGSAGYAANTAAFPFSSTTLSTNYTTPGPIRVHVWKVTQ